MSSGCAFDRMPAVGTFLYPVGHQYCVQVLGVHEQRFGADGRPGLPLVRYRRWGWRDGAPFDDGCGVEGGVGMRLRGPGVWSSPALKPERMHYGAKLWRSVPRPPVRVGGGEQGDLFA